MSNRSKIRAATPIAVAAWVLVTAAGTASVAGQDYTAPRTAFGTPDLNGIWEAIGAHHWNIEPHAASHGPVVELGGLGAIPGGLGIVQGGVIPYTAAARAMQQENAQYWVERDPAAKCYMPGIPRATYMPYPFQIVQTDDYILFAYEFASASRVVYMNRPDFEAPVDAWMGHSLGSWDGETLVIDVTAQMPDTWLDSNGNHHSNQIHVVERYTATSPHHLQYEATIEDPEVYTRPWTVSLPLYRRIDENMQLLELKCVEFAEELMYGRLRKDPDLTPVYRPSGHGSARMAEGPWGTSNDFEINQLLNALARAFEIRDAEFLSSLFRDSAVLTLVAHDIVLVDRGSIKKYYSDLFSEQFTWALELPRNKRIVRSSPATADAEFTLTRTPVGGGGQSKAIGTLKVRCAHQKKDGSGPWKFSVVTFE